MEPSSSTSGENLQDLLAELHDLKTRVHNLEVFVGLNPGIVDRTHSEPVPISGTPAETVPASEAGVEVPSLSTPSTLIPLFGKALVGLAAAYLLRALAEMGLLVLPLGVAIAILYSLVWLMWAARTPEAERSAAAVKAMTSVLILVPVLWEAQVRFNALSPWVVAAVLIFFSSAGLIISWRKNLTTIAWITTLAGLFTACALLVTTRDLLPFTAALLGLALAVELSACLEHWVRERWVVAIAANFAVLLMAFVATRPGGIPEGYAEMSRGAVLGSQIALVAIYLSSTIVRTLWRGFTVTAFEITQTFLALLISMSGSIRVAEGSALAVLSVGAFSAVCGLACYLVSSAFLAHGTEKGRNFHTYATFGLFLSLAGSMLLLAGTPRVAAWSALGILFVRFGRLAGRMTLKWHGAVYLLAAAVGSGIGGVAAQKLLFAGPHAASEPLPPAAWIAAVAAMLAVVLLVRGPLPESPTWHYRMLSALLAGNAAWAVLGIIAALLHHAPLIAQPHFYPTLLTVALVIVSAGVASAAPRLDRPELVWLAYAFMGLATYKLIIQDMRQAHTLAIVFSLLAYGGMLVLLPRILQRTKRAKRAASAVAG
jgi:hypothetical protein